MTKEREPLFDASAILSSPERAEREEREERDGGLRERVSGKEWRRWRGDLVGAEGNAEGVQLVLLGRHLV